MNAPTALISIGLIAAGLSLLGPRPAADAEAATVQAPDTYSVDPVHSTAIFRIKHLDVSYFYGRFNRPTGDFTFDPENPARSSFDITLLTKNIDTHSPKRDGHLKSADFFNAKQFPEITFKSTSVKKVRGDTLQVIGDLGLHGQTRQITIDLQHVGSRDTGRMGQRCGFETTFTIKRSDFGMKYMLNGLGDEVTLMISLEGSKK
ncbi:MAG: YceI family protein [Planctomycetes bacterium]|nr:YceI family protein [Planctomycetota bacterium]